MQLVGPAGLEPATERLCAGDTTHPRREPRPGRAQVPDDEPQEAPRPADQDAILQARRGHARGSCPPGSSADGTRRVHTPSSKKPSSIFFTGYMVSAVEASLQVRYPSAGPNTSGRDTAQLSDRAHLREQRDAGATRSAWLCPSRRARRFSLSTRPACVRPERRTDPPRSLHGAVGARSRSAAIRRSRHDQRVHRQAVGALTQDRGTARDPHLRQARRGNTRGCRDMRTNLRLAGPSELRPAGPLRPQSRRTPATLPSTKHAARNRRREWPNRP